LFLSFFFQVSRPLLTLDHPRTFVIKPGSGLYEIALELKEEGLVKNPLFVLLAAKQMRVARSLKAGEYMILPGMNLRQILNLFSSGQVIPKEVKVVIPEGFNLRQTAARLYNAHVIKNEKAFLELAGRKQTLHLGFDLEVPSLEGYLLPDTYIFFKQSSPQAVIKKFIDNLRKKVLSLPEMQGINPARFQRIIIMASLLEKEVLSYHDKRIVAGILWKRLDKGMPLQVDSSVNFALGWKKKRLSYEDLKIDSPFNTYARKGLPPSPICNPGIESIKAAAQPLDSRYWYYLSAPSGRTIFSQTLQEHNQAKRKYF